ncbi:peptidase inhibitor family I36 protein [Brevibacterium otitidis]|uniref:Peptidase inhibitor family I36 protein n=2 Tax=Brevibacterium otitidis TaxID=53364 RepID=A0ABV5WYQ9_9MICO
MMKRILPRVALATPLIAVLLTSAAVVPATAASPADAPAFSATAAGKCETGDFCVYTKTDFKGDWFGTRKAWFDWSCWFASSQCSIYRKVNDKDRSWRNKWQNRSVQVFKDKNYKSKTICLKAGQSVASSGKHEKKGSSHKNTTGKKTC